MSGKSEKDPIQEETKPVDPKTKMWVSDNGDLILEPSSDDRRYPFMPTVTEVLVGYCIQSDLEVPKPVLEMVSDDISKFIEEEWNNKGLKERIEENKKKGLLSLGNPFYLAAFTEQALKSRGVENIEKEGAYGVFQRPIQMVVGDSSLQDILENTLPSNLIGVLGKQGFSGYILSSY